MSKFDNVLTVKKITCDDNINYITTITIYFEEINKMLILTAYGDCCSDSWYDIDEESSNSILIGRKMIGYVEHDEETDGFEPFGPQECDKRTKHDFLMEDNNNFSFYLNNSSNGYYSGWTEHEWVNI